MKTALINNELSLSYPDSFQVMNEDDMRKAFQDDNPCRFCIRDTDRHLLVSVLWHKSGRLLSAIADPKSVAQGTDAKLKKALKNSRYQNTGYFQRELCGKKTTGFTYEYVVSDIPMSSEVVVLKHKEVCYTIYWYARKSNPASDHQIFEDILQSVSLQQ